MTRLRTFTPLLLSICMAAPAFGQQSDTIFQDGFDGPAGCLNSAQRMQRLTVCYDANLSSCVTSDDVTQFTTIWGRTSASGQILPFPGQQVPVFFRNFDKAKYIAAEIDVPLNLPANQTGIFTHGGTLGDPNLTMSISPVCGDFIAESSLCVHADVNPESIMVPWRVPTYTGNQCVLTPGHTYYANIKVTNPALPNVTCNNGGRGNFCTISVQSNHTP